MVRIFTMGHGFVLFLCSDRGRFVMGVRPFTIFLLTMLPCSLRVILGSIFCSAAPIGFCGRDVQRDHILIVSSSRHQVCSWFFVGACGGGAETDRVFCECEAARWDNRFPRIVHIRGSREGVNEIQWSRRGAARGGFSSPKGNTSSDPVGRRTYTHQRRQLRVVH